MLAYVFWHRRKQASREEYEKRLTKFHETLASSQLWGFRGSVVARIVGAAPWFSSSDSEESCYEDWYLLEGSEVLDRLNEAAVTDSRKDPHDSIASLATDTHGGLYQLKTGGSLASSASSSSVSASFAHWVSKPAGRSYEVFYADIAKYLQSERTGLWRRQMTLGPTPEFCIMAEKKMDVR